MIRVRKAVLSLVFALVGNTACSDAAFKNGGDTKVSAQAATIKCDSTRMYPAESLNVPFDATINPRLQISGDFCPQASAQLSVLFVVDFSLSMFNKAEDRGNDPVVDGTCGRLDAAKAIIDRYRTSVPTVTKDGAKTSLKIGVVSFSADAKIQVPLTPMSDFASAETTDNFCVGLAGTNYKAGFDEATDVLKDEPGTKVIFFISDGLPTEGGGGTRESAPRHRQAALSAIGTLKEAVTSLTVNTVFLGNIHNVPEADLDPEAFLVELTGDEARVKLASNAEKLVEQILTLEAPKAQIDPATASAVIVGTDGIQRPIAITLFAADGTRPGVWSFATDSFVANPPGQSPAAAMIISAKDDKGLDYKVELTIVAKALP